MAVSYQYNGANELIRENNHTNSYTMTYEYDSWGNLTKKQRYAYTTATDPGTPTETITYTYGNSTWKDRLTKYNGQTISYDSMGNPTTYLGKTLTWNGKELTGVTGTASYTYDMNGLRTTKTVGGVTTNYFYNNTVLMGLTSGSNRLLFSYDANGLVQAVNFNGTYYYYIRNGQGDIIKLVDADGTAVVKYSYDSWGKQLSCTSTLATTLGVLNPFRYRGYVYDEETGFYYLKSRYYDPETCRFISADVYLSTGQGVLGHNCYAYCLNNPIGMVDPTGNWSLSTLYTAIAVAAAVVAAVAVVVTCGAAAPAVAIVGGGIIGGTTSTAVVATATTVAMEATVVAATAATAAVVTNAAEERIDDKLNSHNNSVYVLVDNGGTVQYVGRTKDVSRRKAAHNANPYRQGLEMQVLASGLSYKESRALEQSAMAYYHTINTANKMNNQINSVTPKHWKAYKEIALGTLNYGWNQLTNEILYWADS